jgi:ubiquinone/menaquinone biosynthesis C-methylase UbiE
MTKMSEREFEAFQSYVLATKLFWTSDMFAELKTVYERKLAEGAGADLPAGPERVETVLKDEALDRFHRWFERHLQRMKYSGRYGLVPFHESRRNELKETLDAAPADNVLELDDDIKLPAYYTDVDVHQHPGGVWSDELAGLVYERGARSTTPLLTRDRDLHERFADLVRSMQPEPQAILDMGCGFGKTTQPLAEVNPEAAVVGVDLSAPCLKVAARNATLSQFRNLRYAQRDATRTGYDDGTFDVVASSMLLHEMPSQTVRDVVLESRRVLRPGGWMIHLDFLPPDDEFLTYLHIGHSHRNNEPWMRSLMSMNIAEVMRAAQFDEIRIEPFEEAVGALAQAGQKWRFPWAIIAGRKSTEVSQSK